MIEDVRYYTFKAGRASSLQVDTCFMFICWRWKMTGTSSLRLTLGVNEEVRVSYTGIHSPCGGRGHYTHTHTRTQHTHSCYAASTACMHQWLPQRYAVMTSQFIQRKFELKVNLSVNTFKSCSHICCPARVHTQSSRTPLHTDWFCFCLTVMLHFTMQSSDFFFPGSHNVHKSLFQPWVR